MKAEAMARPAITVDESISGRFRFRGSEEVIIMFFMNDNLFKLL